jgi:hypothetical protein
MIRHAVSMIPLVIALAAVVVRAQSPQPPNQQQSTSDRGNGSPQPATISPTPPADAPASAEERDRREEIAIQSRIAQFTKLLVIFGTAVGVLQLFVLIAQATIYRQMKDHTLVIERAYVAISHAPPGLKFGYEDTSGNDVSRQDAAIKIKITNHGNTPARVTKAVIHQWIVREPIQPLSMSEIHSFYDSSASDSIEAMIAPNDSLYLPKVLKIPVADIKTVKSMGNMFSDCKTPLRIFVVGYVEYWDRFEKRYRSTYARMFDPWQEVKEGTTPDDPIYRTKKEYAERYKKRNNLIFNTPSGYNTDYECDEQGRPVSPKEQP